MEEQVAPEPRPAGRVARAWAFARRHRWALVIVLLVGLFLVEHYTGLGDLIDADQIRDWIRHEGWWGVAIFAGLFAVGELIHVPGLVFVGAATYVYTGWQAVIVAFIGAMTSVTFSFVVIRFLGGQPLKRIRWKIIKRLLAHLDERPITVVLLLRLTLWMAPVVNYVLAMSHVRFRDYLIGSAIGLALPVMGVALLFEELPEAFEWVSRLWG